MQFGLHIAQGKAWFSPLQAKLAPSKSHVPSLKPATHVFPDDVIARNQPAAVTKPGARVAHETMMIARPSSMGVMLRPANVVPRKPITGAVNFTPRKPVGAPPTMPNMAPAAGHTFHRVGSATQPPPLTLASAYNPFAVQRGLPQQTFADILGRNGDWLAKPKTAALVRVQIPVLEMRKMQRLAPRVA